MKNEIFVKVLPMSDYKVQEGDILVVVDNSKDIEFFEKQYEIICEVLH